MRTKITVLILLCAISSLIYSQSFEYGNGDNIDITKQGQAYNSSVILKPGSYIPDSASYVEGETYVESFEGAAFPPAGWKTWNFLGKQKWMRAGAGFIGARSAVLNYENQGYLDGEDWLITPQLTVSAGDSLTFYMKPVYAGKIPDTLYILVSTNLVDSVTTDSSLFAPTFKDVLMKIDAGSLTSTWKRFSCQVGKYAGQKIYIAFKDVNRNGSGVYIDHVTFGKVPAKDIMFYWLDYKNVARAGDYVDFYADFYNLGSAIQDVPLYVEIPEAGFKSKVDALNFGAGEFYRVGFDSWEAGAPGKYTVLVYSALPGDDNTANDTLIVPLNVYEGLPGTWHSETPLPNAKRSFGAASYVKKSGDPAIPDTTFIYTAAGQYYSGYSSDINAYNTVTHKWFYSQKQFQYPMYSHKAAQIGGKLYIPGGIAAALISPPNQKTLYIYDIENDQLTKGANMPYDLSNYAIGTYGDSLLFVMGGYNFNNYVQNSILIYNPKTNSWSYGTPFPGEGLFTLSGSILGNTIVLTGGSNHSGANSTMYIGTIDPQNPASITWKESKFPSGAVSEMSSGSWEGKNYKYIFFAGGQWTNPYSSIKYPRDFWAYDVKKDKWYYNPDKNMEAEAASGVIPVLRNDSLFAAVLGGQGSWGFNVTNEWLYIGPESRLTKDGKDASPVSVDFDTVYINKAFTPKATFVNKQITPQSFEVSLSINDGEYFCSKVVDSLLYDEERQVEFDPWTPDSAGTYSAVITTLLAGDEDGSNDAIFASITVIDTNSVGVKDGKEEIPAVYSLSQNYPNPFNPSTVIKYSLAQAGRVELKLYNMLGQEVQTLVNEIKNAGAYEVKFNAAGMNLASGVYLYRLKAGSFVQTKKLMLIK